MQSITIWNHWLLDQSIKVKKKLWALPNCKSSSYWILNIEYNIEYCCQHTLNMFCNILCRIILIFTFIFTITITITITFIDYSAKKTERWQKNSESRQVSCSPFPSLHFTPASISYSLPKNNRLHGAGLLPLQLPILSSLDTFIQHFQNRMTRMIWIQELRKIMMLVDLELGLLSRELIDYLILNWIEFIYSWMDRWICMVYDWRYWYWYR